MERGPPPLRGSGGIGSVDIGEQCYDVLRSVPRNDLTDRAMRRVEGAPPVATVAVAVRASHIHGPMVFPDQPVSAGCDDLFLLHVDRPGRVDAARDAWYCLPVYGGHVLETEGITQIEKSRPIEFKLSFHSHDLPVHAESWHQALQQALGTILSSRSSVRILQRRQGQTASQKGKHASGPPAASHALSPNSAMPHLASLHATLRSSSPFNAVHGA